jgi:type IV pilus assembly protein PilC
MNTPNYANKTVPTIEKGNFCRYLSTMIRSGTPILDAVDLLMEQTTNKNLSFILQETKGELEKGRTLYESFQKFPGTFDTIFLTVIKAGEESGTLDKSLDYLGKQLIADYYLIQKVNGALMYPAVIVTAMGLMGILMMGFVLPRIAKVFMSSGFPLPTVTLIIFQVSLFFSNYIFIILPAIIGLGAGIGWYFLKGPGKKLVTQALPHLPLVQRIFNDLDVARFTRILGTLLQSGVPITESLKIASSSLTLVQYQRLGGQLSAEIARGGTMTNVLHQSKDRFPKMVTGMIAIGEQTGALQQVLFDIADFYDQEVDNSLKNFTTLLEPIIMVVVGIGVALMVLAIITPIYSLVGNLQAPGGK